MSSEPQHTEASVGPDRYDDLVQLADLFEATGEDLRARARLGVEVLGDEDVSASAELSATTYNTAADDIRAATTGKNGVLNRSIELDADALVVRATVLTYRGSTSSRTPPIAPSGRSRDGRSATWHPRSRWVVRSSRPA